MNQYKTEQSLIVPMPQTEITVKKPNSHSQIVQILKLLSIIISQDMLLYQNFYLLESWKIKNNRLFLMTCNNPVISLTVTKTEN